MTQSTTQIHNTGGTGCLVRGLYFIFIGWWFGLLWVLAAWFLNLTIIGLPLGLGNDQQHSAGDDHAPGAGSNHSPGQGRRSGYSANCYYPAPISAARALFPFSWFLVKFRLDVACLDIPGVHFWPGAAAYPSGCSTAFLPLPPWRVRKSNDQPLLSRYSHQDAGIFFGVK